MGTALGPSHLLSLDKSLTQNLVDGRLNKGRGNGFSMPITVAVIGNKGSVGANVGPEFSNDLQQLPLLLAVVFDVQSEFQIVHDLQRLVNISMPEIPFEAFEFFFDFGAQIRLVICIDALGHLTHHRQPHRDVEPVQKMLGLRVQVHLEIADRIAAIRQERNRLVHLHPLRFKHHEQTAFRFVP